MKAIFALSLIFAAPFARAEMAWLPAKCEAWKITISTFGKDQESLEVSDQLVASGLVNYYCGKAAVDVCHKFMSDEFAKNCPDAQGATAEKN